MSHLKHITYLFELYRLTLRRHSLKRYGKIVFDSFSILFNGGLTSNCTLAAFTITVFFCLPLEGVYGGTQQLDSIHKTILAGSRANRERLGAVKLIWTCHTKENKFIGDRTIETSGDFTMWTKDDKVAVLNMYDHVYSDNTIKKGGTRAAFNGKDFRAVRNIEKPKRIGIANKPDYHLHENWFEIIGWTKLSWLDRMRDGLKGFAFEKTSFYTEGGERYCRVAIENPKVKTRIILSYNLDRGFCCTHVEIFESDRLKVEQISKAEEVQAGCWLPVEYTERSLSVKSGDIELENRFKLKLEECTFGDPDAIPDDIFKIRITPEMVVQDKRYGETLVYTGTAMPLSLEEAKNRATNLSRDDESGPPAKKFHWRLWLIIANIGIITLCVCVWFIRLRRTV